MLLLLRNTLSEFQLEFNAVKLESLRQKANVALSRFASALNN